MEVAKSLTRKVSISTTIENINDILLIYFIAKRKSSKRSIIILISNSKLNKGGGKH